MLFYYNHFEKKATKVPEIKKIKNKEGFELTNSVEESK